jgi:hypothetical protein
MGEVLRSRGEGERLDITLNTKNGKFTLSESDFK